MPRLNLISMSETHSQYKIVAFRTTTFWGCLIGQKPRAVEFYGDKHSLVYREHHGVDQRPTDEKTTKWIKKQIELYNKGGHHGVL